MSEADKVQKARELVELTGRGKRVDFGRPPSEEFRKIREEQDRRLLELSIELHVKHMSEEQLDALLDFYKSNMGKSVLEANRIISEKFRERFHDTMSVSTPRTDGAAWIASSSGYPAGKRDT